MPFFRFIAEVRATTDVYVEAEDKEDARIKAEEFNFAGLPICPECERKIDNPEIVTITYDTPVYVCEDEESIEAAKEWIEEQGGEA